MKRIYIDEIMSGKRMDDARLEDTSIRGRIALVDSNTYEIIGYAELLATKRISYEEYVKWHICKDYDSLTAQSYIDNLEFLKLQSPSFLYKLGFVEKRDIPAIINPINETNTWVQFSEDNLINGYEQFSLF